MRKYVLIILLQISFVGRIIAVPVTLPVLPLPKSWKVLSDDVVGHGYDSVQFSFVKTDPSDYKRVCDEITDLCKHPSESVLKVNGTLCNTRRALAGVCIRSGLDVSYADSIRNDGYILSYDKGSIQVFAKSKRGLFYGLQTVKQLLRGEYPNSICIADWPDMPERIFMDDISRGPIPTVSSIKKYIRRLSEMKYTGLTFYIEHVVKTKSYPDFAPEDGHLSISDIKDICRYAGEYQMEVIGSFQCFGHMEKILSNKKYSSMGSTSSMISPVSSEAKNFLRHVVGELAEASSSEYFNVNCDETWDLEKGTTAPVAKEMGVARFYASHIKFLYDVLKSKGKKLMLWGDMTMKYPEIISLLPKDVTYLSWNYGGVDYTSWIEPFYGKGKKYMACPGVVSSNRLYPDYRMTEENMKFIFDAYAKGACGMFMTSWDDENLHNFSSIAYGVAMAGECAWNVLGGSISDTFKERFNKVCLGCDDTRFTDAVYELMKLTDIGMTYQMNNHVFNEKIIPDSLVAMNINRDELNKVRIIVDSVQSMMDDLHSRFNDEDIKSLKYVVSYYDFLIRSKELMFDISAIYNDPVIEKDRASVRKKMIDGLQRLEDLSLQLIRIKNQYSRLWFAENQSYSYDYGINLYDDKLRQIDKVISMLRNSIDAIDSGNENYCSNSGFLVREINSNYLSTWLIVSGLIQSTQLDKDYLENIGGESKASPIPGERFSCADGEKKWTRIISDNGFVVDLHRIDVTKNTGLTYASIEIFADEDRDECLLFGCSGESIIFVNGEKVLHTARENEFTADKYKVKLHLKKGSNRIMVKALQLVPQWSFSARIDGRILKSHKQKYYIN